MKLKSIFAILTAGVLACTGLTACGDDKAASNQKATFTVGFDQDFPPFGYVDENGEFTGFDLELAKEAAKRMDMEIKLQPIDWDSKELELSSGSISCIWNR